MLERLLNNPPQTLLIEGGEEASHEATQFACAILKSSKSCPVDLRSYSPEGKSDLHQMESMKELIHEASLPPYEAKRKIFLIHQAEKMRPSSSHALLKILEEPPSFVILILITEHIEKILPTITSRSFFVSLKKQGERKSESLELAFELGIRLLREEMPSQKEIPENVDPKILLNQLLHFFRDLHLLRSQGASSLLYFKEKEKQLSKISHPIPSLESLERQYEVGLEALALNLPLTHFLPYFLLPGYPTTAS